MIDTIAGSVAFVTTMIGVVPQIIKGYRTKSMKDVSLVMLLNCLLCCIAWLIHGMCVADYTLVWSEVFCTITTIIVLIQKHQYAA